MQNLSKQNLLKTKDGSFSLYSEAYGDCYHSAKDGAILETLYKHIIPTFALINIDSTTESTLDSIESHANNIAESTESTPDSEESHANNIAESAESTLDSAESPAKHITESTKFTLESTLDSPDSTHQNPIKILDICFGLGYNALFTLAFAKRENIALSVHSVELHLLENLRTFAYPKILSHYLPLREILDALFLRGAWESGHLSIYLHKGDAKDYIQHLAHQKLQKFTFDIIYQDAFSPTKNAELWDLAHFQNLFALLKNNGAISTYSTSKKIREICKGIGFKVYNMRCGNLKNGTILRKNPHIKSIDCIKLNKI